MRKILPTAKERITESGGTNSRRILRFRKTYASYKKYSTPTGQVSSAAAHFSTEKRQKRGAAIRRPLF